MSEQENTRIRASDAEREQVAAVVRHAMGEGRLSLSEGEERLAAVYASTYQDELPMFTADLPPYRQGSPGPDQAEGGASGANGSASGPGTGRPPGAGLVPAALAASLAGLAILWAVVGGGPVWPAIVLGVLAFVWLKHRWFGRRRHWDPRNYGCAAHRRRPAESGSRR